MIVTAAVKTDDDGRSTALLLATIRAARGGDERAFEELMMATERRVALLAWRILGDAEEVKEAVQETFLCVFRHLGRYDEGRDFFGWLFSIAVNVCRDLDRRRRRRRIFTSIDDTPHPAGDESPDEAIGRRREIALLTRAIDALPEKERLAILLREVQELSTDQVAAILGSRPATVRVQISRARAKLRQWMEARRGGGRP
ncbi:MAG TPA: sigma-70 family RNA polymerase sigma factor [Thermoanaerobaculia bacterium]|nr:sigma-70 family RNA polymerase sigma factor [Thermoanaerobaculia bacterium]